MEKAFSFGVFGTVLFLLIFVLVAPIAVGGIAGENFNGRVISFVPVTGLWKTEKLTKGKAYCLRKAGVENPERVEKGLKPLLNENTGEFLKTLMKKPEYSISLFKSLLSNVSSTHLYPHLSQMQLSLDSSDFVSTRLVTT